MKAYQGFILLGLTWALSATAALPPEKIGMCIACHGETGISTNPAWPHLAGQHAAYLFKQLKDMQENKTRPVPVMQAILVGLSQEELMGMAEFYAAQPLPTGITPEAYLERGEALYRGGDFEKQITACIACHGPTGEGNAQAGFPVLSGQHALYTQQQLKGFHDKVRRNDLNAIMQDISAKMDEQDMKAVAYYVQGLRSE